MKTSLIALATAATLLGAASTTAFAGPDVGPLNAEQYQVSAQQTLSPLLAQRTTAERLPARQWQVSVGKLIGPADPHAGPAFDPDVE